MSAPCTSWLDVNRNHFSDVQLRILFKWCWNQEDAKDGGFIRYKAVQLEVIHDRSAKTIRTALQGLHSPMMIIPGIGGPLERKHTTNPRWVRINLMWSGAALNEHYLSTNGEMFPILKQGTFPHKTGNISP